MHYTFLSQVSESKVQPFFLLYLKISNEYYVLHDSDTYKLMWVRNMSIFKIVLPWKIAKFSVANLWHKMLICSQAFWVLLIYILTYLHVKIHTYLQCLNVG